MHWCEQVERRSDHPEQDSWQGVSGSAAWDRGGATYSLENRAQSPADLLVVELLDSFAITQIRVPLSERDPLRWDTHFRRILDTDDVRVFALHLNPRDATEQVQFASRIEIPLSEFQVNEELSNGKIRELTQRAGEMIWKENELKSIVNVGPLPADKLFLELKHPFCYQAEEKDTPMTPSTWKWSGTWNR